MRLGVERDDAHTAQIGQLLRGLPIVHCGVSLIEIADEALNRWDGLGKQSAVVDAPTKCLQ